MSNTSPNAMGDWPIWENLEPRKCGYSECGRTFKPKQPQQKQCSDECTRAKMQARAKAKRLAAKKKALR